jgi:hypothetical protein
MYQKIWTWSMAMNFGAVNWEKNPNHMRSELMRNKFFYGCIRQSTNFRIGAPPDIRRIASLPLLCLLLAVFGACFMSSPAAAQNDIGDLVIDRLQLGGQRMHSGLAARLWHEGRVVWSKELIDGMYDDLAILVEEAVESFTARQGASTVLMICLPRRISTETLMPHGQERTRRGLRGARLETDGTLSWLCPHEMIASNTDIGVRVGGKNDRSTMELWDFTEVAVFWRDDHIVVEKTVRGKRLLTMADVSLASARETMLLLGGWLTRAVQPDGRMTYRFFPSLGREGNGNNMIRQFMATLSLVRFAKAHPELRLTPLVRANIEYNVNSFYREIDGAGVIEYRDKRKLGAFALAALAIWESPFRDQFGGQLQQLITTIDSMWQLDGAFQTYYRSTRTGGQNYYPGETLLLWATMMAEQPDPRRLEQFNKSVRYYLDYHRRNPNPAFIPWHTQAYYIVWQHTRDKTLREAIFTMNDWLVEVMQQWDGDDVLPDERGRFFSPHHYFGPPHASSTGVYLEGLVDAYRLAAAVDDQIRKKRYKTAIMRGLRSIQQLQFTDAVDMFYVTRPHLVAGGVRTTVSENTIRVDNVQHNLMALMKVLDTFTAEDFYPETGAP